MHIHHTILLFSTRTCDTGTSGKMDRLLAKDRLL